MPPYQSDGKVSKEIGIGEKDDVGSMASSSYNCNTATTKRNPVAHLDVDVVVVVVRAAVRTADTKT